MRSLLNRHPRVGSVSASETEGIDFQVDSWSRRILVGSPECELYGLVETMDNNPLVCADQISVPGPAATLALIALAPLCLSGLLADSPVLLFNFEAEGSEVEAALSASGWPDGAAIHCESVDLGGVLACTAMASIKTPEDMDDVDAIYEERFGRSFYVVRDESSEWSPELVRGLPIAVYRLSVSVDEPHSLLKVSVLADPDGKCGATQIVHAMNVMCGFEETLGIN